MKKINFRPVSKEAEAIADKPQPAKKYFPEWYKQASKYKGNKFFVDDNGTPNLTFKSCMPFFDTFTTGYIQETWCDINIENIDGTIGWQYSIAPEIIEQRSTLDSIPRIDGFVDADFSWRQPWVPQMPEGYSMIYTHPLNRYDLPFLSLTGIIDNDKYYMERFPNHPFFIREGFSGIIPKGTPMFQMIPIKRERWKSYFGNFEPELFLQFLKVRKTFSGGYKKMFWNKKIYE